VNDAPAITGTSSGQAVDDDATDHPFSAATIGDPDFGASETVTITLKVSGLASDANGVLSGGGVTRTSTGTYTLSGTPADVTTALQALTFTPAAHEIAPGGTVTTGMTLSVADGIAGSPTTDVTTTVIATAVNDPPSIADTTAGQTVYDNATLHPFAETTIGDPDFGASETVTITLKASGLASDANGVLSGTGVTKSGTGTYTLTGTPSAVTTALQALTFTPTAHQIAPGGTVTTGMTLSVTDGIVGSPTTDATTTVIATMVNDPPAITGTMAGQAVTDEATLTPFSTVAISDVDFGQTETVTVTLSADANGTLFSGKGGSYDSKAGSTPSPDRMRSSAPRSTPWCSRQPFIR